MSRLTALFQRGEVVRVGEDEDGDVLVWVNALTSIERDECVLDASVAQAAERELNGPGSAAYEAAQVELERSPRDQIVDGLCLNRATEAWMLAQDDLHSEEGWRGDRLLLIERMEASIDAGMEISDEERTRYNELNTRYLAAWREKTEARVEAMRAEYRVRETRELIAEYLKAWLDTRAIKAQADEYRISQLYFSTRICRATRKSDDSYDHSSCDGHIDLVFPSRRHVRQADDRLLAVLIPVADGIDKRGGDAAGKA